MLGPYTAGGLYVAEENLERLDVSWVGARASTQIDMEAGTYSLWPDARRFEMGPFPWPMYFAMMEAAHYLERLGLDAVEKQTAQQARYLRAGLRDIPGVCIYSPENQELATGIVAFGIQGLLGRDISQALRSRWNIITRPTFIRFNAVRVSVGFFTTQQELDTLLEAVSTLAGDERDLAYE